MAEKKKLNIIKRTYQMSLKRKANHLSINDLSDSDSSSDDQVLLREVTELQGKIHQNQKEKRQLDLKIEGLEHDLLCAQEARKLGNDAAVNIARKLAALFGEALKDEDLVERIRQLQEKAQNAKEEVESLRSQLGAMKLSTPVVKRDAKRRLNSVHSDIDTTKMEQQKLLRDGQELDREIEEKLRIIEDLKEKQLEILGSVNAAVGSEQWTPEEICSRIIRNSDKHLLKQCKRVVRQFGMEVDVESNVSKILDQLQKRMENMRKELLLNEENQAYLAKMSEQVEASISDLNAVKEETAKLKAEKQILEEENECDENLNFQVDEVELEQQRRKERKETLIKELQKALQLVGYNWTVPKTYEGTCEMCGRFIKAIREEVCSLENEDHNVPERQVAYLQTKVNSVRRQNRVIAKTIKKC